MASGSIPPQRERERERGGGSHPSLTVKIVVVAKERLPPLSPFDWGPRKEERAEAFKRASWESLPPPPQKSLRRRLRRRLLPCLHSEGALSGKKGCSSSSSSSSGSGMFLVTRLVGSALASTSSGRGDK